MYAIQAQVSRVIDGWQSSRQVPTFYLAERLQGIVSEDHAARIAKSVIDPYDLYEVHVTAVKL